MRFYIVLCMVLAIAFAVLADSDEWKRFGKGFHMGFGKRAPIYKFKGFQMGFKRSSDYNNMYQNLGGLHMGFKRSSLNPTDSQEDDKRYSNFHMGFGKRAMNLDPYSKNFYMGLGKESDTV